MYFALNRANSVYLSVFAVFVIGLWVILDLGSAFLTAPRDLSGNWRLVDASQPSESPSAFSITQSGRYLRFAFERGPKFDVVLANSAESSGQTLQFAGQGWNVTGVESATGDAMNFKFQSPAASGQSPLSGTYRRQRMGQEGSAPLQLPVQQPQPSPPNAATPNAGH